MRKNLLFLALIMIAIIGNSVVTFGQNTYEQKIQEFRNLKDSIFSNAAISPLTPAQIAKFSSLDYFAIDEDFKVNGELIKDDEERPVNLQMSDGSFEEFIKYGEIELVIDSKKYKFPVFRKGSLVELAGSPYELFLPFKDKTTATSSSPIGRYVSIEIPEEGKDAVIDFNTAINPFSTYNNGHTSPIAPAASMFNGTLMLGERKYEDR